MLLAVFSDIHGNRQAFEACLKVARAKGAERFVLLGDFVGYGADPEWVVDTVMGLVREGAIAVRGNHDEAVNTTTEAMNAEAQIAIEWTRGRLDVAQRRFLAELPMLVDEKERLYVHSEASSPQRWHYVRSTADAAKSLISTPAHVTFCGHIHRPALYSMSVTAKMTGPRAQDRRFRAAAARAAMAGRARLGGPASRWRSIRSLRAVRHRVVPDHLLPRAL
ncbi:putative phosphodiesterase [Bradyrhizobium sp. i1.7.7]